VQIKRDGGHISIRDRVAPFWALGLFLLAGAVVALAMPLGLASNAADLEPWERLASVAVGVGAGAGALWWLERSPWTHVQLDLTRRLLRLVRYALSGRRVRWLSFDELESACRSAPERPAGAAVGAVEPRSGGGTGGTLGRGRGLPDPLDS
jgi:hypothetical protein